MNHVSHLETIVSACQSSGSACNADIGPDDKVTAEGGAQEFTVHWGWLRDALAQAVKDNPAGRAQAMDRAAAHLKELADQSSSAADPATQARNGAEFTRSQQKVQQVLARREFQHVHEVSWWDRFLARLDYAISRLFAGIGEFGSAFPGLGTVLEIVFFVVAAAGLLFFVFKSFERQRMQIKMSPGEGQLTAWDREATDWAKDAETWAAQSEWREAVHCLYWAAIVRLEARRAWKHNPARTPREYVRLLQPGSPQQGALRSLTRIFERVWYGLREAQRGDYERARDLFEGLGESAANSRTELQA